mmetsp:Transcript_26240/g.63799  ORF Transcript_26240/g.63799 Transcript_26240/m.63799 type:complete len:205 (-) Transcript_26240:227-841(-)
MRFHEPTAAPPPLTSKRAPADATNWRSAKYVPLPAHGKSSTSMSTLITSGSISTPYSSSRSTPAPLYENVRQNLPRPLNRPVAQLLTVYTLSAAPPSPPSIGCSLYALHSNLASGTYRFTRRTTSSTPGVNTSSPFLSSNSISARLIERNASRLAYRFGGAMDVSFMPPALANAVKMSAPYRLLKPPSGFSVKMSASALNAVSL